MPNKIYDPLEQLPDRLQKFYQNEYHGIPRDNSLRNLNVVIKDILKDEHNINDIITEIREHAPKINSNQLKKIRDNFKAGVIECYDNKANLKIANEQIDTSFKGLIEARKKTEQMPTLKVNAPGFTR
ncbi:MAG: hypothetical protein KAH96_04335 [Alphaproteobacteria bacterium]|nr:hypothetical protein [Alphaproteobacteria bacterium]